MLGKLPSQLSSLEVERLYGKAWLLTHYLRLERKGQLALYLRAINRGKSSLEAARLVFGNLRAVERALRKYKKRDQLAGLRVDPAMIDEGEIELRALDPGAAAMMGVRMVSRRGVTEKGARGDRKCVV